VIIERIGSIQISPGADITISGFATRGEIGDGPFTANRLLSELCRLAKLGKIAEREIACAQAHQWMQGP
jgi:hypothetical protein